MYKTAYVCDYCGKEMEIPMYTLELKTNSLSFYVQDRVSWHYCEDCWEDVKKALTEKNNKDIEQLRKDNEWYKKFFMSMYESFMDSLFNTAVTTTTVSDEKITCNGPFTEKCCCESADKDDLDYKQSVGMI